MKNSAIRNLRIAQTEINQKLIMIIQYLNKTEKHDKILKKCCGLRLTRITEGFIVQFMYKNMLFIPALMH